MRRDPRVTLYYADHKNAIGYVTLAGRGVLVEDMQEILKRKRAYWDQAFPGLKNLVLIKVVPERLDVLNYKAGTQADPETWRTPSIELGPTASRLTRLNSRRAVSAPRRRTLLLREAMDWANTINWFSGFSAWRAPGDRPTPMPRWPDPQAQKR
jgi:hypothetical protein